MRNIVNFLELARIWIAPLTILPFVVGGIAAKADFRVLVVLALGGFAFHAYSNQLNDLTDRDADRKNPRRASSPLVAGSVTVEQLTLWVAIEAAALAVAVSLLPRRPEATVAFLALFLLTTWGNIFQKKSRRVSPLVTDVLFGITVATPLPLATLAAGSSPTWREIALAAGVALQMAVANVTAGNFKDFDADRDAGSRTTSLVLGVTRRGDGSFAFTRPYAVYLLTAQIGSTLCVSALGLDLESTTWLIAWAAALLLCATATACFVTMLLDKSFPSSPGLRGLTRATSGIAANFAAALVCYALVVPGPATILAITAIYIVPVLFGTMRWIRWRWLTPMGRAAT